MIFDAGNENTIGEGDIRLPTPIAGELGSRTHRRFGDGHGVPMMTHVTGGSPVENLLLGVEELDHLDHLPCDALCGLSILLKRSPYMTEITPHTQGCANFSHYRNELGCGQFFENLDVFELLRGGGLRGSGFSRECEECCKQQGG